MIAFSVDLVRAVPSAHLPGAAPAAQGGTPSLPLPSPIEVSKSDELVDDADDNGQASPGDTIEYTVIITNSSTTDVTGLVFSDTIDANTTLAGDIDVYPVAVNDAYDVLGNTGISIGASSGLLANDFDPDNSTLVVVPVTGGTTSQGGDITTNADGSFDYDPPAGYTGTDSFTYSIEDADGLRATGTVTFTISAMIWYVDDDAAAGGDGRLSAPFAAPSAAQVSSGTGDIIFVFSGNYGDGITLKDEQILVGQGVGLASGAGLTPPPGTTLPSSAGDPVLSQGITTGSDNTIRGLTVDSDGNGLTAGNFGTLTVSDVTISAGRALSMTNGTATATFDSVTSSSSPSNGLAFFNVNGAVTINGGAVSSASGSAIVIDGGSADISYPGNINNSSGRSAKIVNRTGGTVTLSGNIDDSGAGILLKDNSGGSVTFSGPSKSLDTGANTALSLDSNTGTTILFSNGGLQINTTSGAGLSATGGGTLAITGADNSINSSGAPAVSISDVTIGGGGITLESVMAANSDRGIQLNNAGSGGFTVTGSGVTDGSGGTIQDITERGIEIVNTDNVSFANLDLINANTSDAGGIGVCDALNTGNCHAAIYLSSVNGATFNNVDISGMIAEQGINGVAVADFIFDNGTISNCGNAVAEGCIKMRNLAGASSISGSTFSFAHEKNVEIHNSGGVLNLTVNSSTFSDTQSSLDGADGLEIVAEDAATVTVTVSGSEFLRNLTNGFAASARNSAHLDVNLTDSTFDPGTDLGKAITLDAINNSTLTFDVTDNPTVYSNGGTAISVAAYDGATLEGRISGNSDIQPGGAGINGSGIRVQIVDNADGELIVEDNEISNIGWDNGIAVTSRPELLATPSGRLDITIRNNTVDLPSADSLYGIDVVAAGSNVACAYVTNNQVTGGGGDAAFRTREASGGTVYLQGFSGDTQGTWTANGNSGSPVREDPTASTSAPPDGTCETPEHAEVQPAELVQVSGEVMPIVAERPLLTPSQRDQFTQQTGGANAFVAARHVPDSELTADARALSEPRARLSASPQTQTIPDVEVGPFDLPAGYAAKIVFRVSIERPFPAGPAQISNQASVRSDSYTTVLSDDPDTPELHDPTVTELLVEADLAISKSDGLAEVVPGQPITYTIVATNNGSNHVGGATVSDSFVADLTAASWTCDAGPGATCTASGSGDIDEEVDLSAGSAITFTVNATVAPGAFGTLSNEATITAPSSISDPKPGNNSASDDTVLTPQVDLALQKTESADPVVAGSGNGNLTYVMTLTNNGPSDASNIIVTEVITQPAGVTLDSIEYNTANATYSNGEWLVSDLDVGQREQLTVTMTVEQTAGAGSDVVGDTATVTGAEQTIINITDDQATELTSITREVDLQVTMSESADPVTAGSGAGNLSYVVTVQNNGPSVASGVTVTDVLSLPPAVTVQSITPGGSTSWDGGTGAWTVGVLSSGGSETLTILLTVGPDAASAANVIANEAALMAVNEEETNSANNRATQTTSITTAADLVLDKSDEPDPIAAGESLTYTLTVTNNGPSDAQNVVVTDSLPNGVTLLQSAGCNQDPDGAPTCSLGTVAAGKTVSYTLQVAVDSTISKTLSNSATLTSDTTEANSGDESDSETTAVNQVVDLQLDVADDPDPAIAGQPLTYTLVITNSGPSVASDVVVTDLLPTDFNYEGDSCSGTLSGADWSWNAGTLDAGESQSCTITGTISVGFSGTLSHGPYVTSAAFDPAPANNTATETTTVHDNRFSIGDATLEEGDAGTTALTFTVTRTTNANTSSVDVQTADAPGDGAVAGEDYTALPLTTLNFTQGGALTQTVTVDVSGDALVELDETFLISLSNPVGGRVVAGEGVGTIVNDDSASVNIEGESHDEGDTGTTTYVFTATLSADVDSNIDVDYSTADDSATSADGDYDDRAGTLTFSGTAGEQQTFTVTVNADTVVELDESFRVQLSNLSTAGRDVTLAGSGQAQGTITNDDSATLVITDAGWPEGDSGTTTYAFTVTLDAAVDSPLSVEYATADDTATTSDSDYSAASGALTFSGTAGEEQTISVVVHGDTKVELDETFLLNLSNLSAAGREVTLADDQALGAITNDDSAALSIVDSSHLEGDSGTTNHVFTVTLSADVDSAVTVDYATADGTAEDENGDGDYTATSGTLSFTGAAGEEKTITVAANGDAVVELDETFLLQLSNVSAGARDVTLAGDGKGEGTIANDDSASLNIVDASHDEGDSGATRYVFTVTLSAGVDTGVAVNYATSDGTAEDENGDGDYASNSGTLTFSGTAGEEQTVTVDVTGETRYELDELFYVDLSDVSASGRQVMIGDGQAEGEIVNDDGPPSITIEDSDVSEAESTAVFTVTLSNASRLPVTVEYGTADGTATTTDGDYTAIPTTTLTIPAGSITGTINVAINDDSRYEANETFVINLAPVTGVEATLADNQATGAIVDDDSPPVLSVEDVTVDETGGSAVFNVTLDAVSGLDVSASYGTSGGTATSGTDFGAASGTILIPAGATTDTITVSISDDTLDELDETFTVSLGIPTNATIGDGQGLGTILDDDPPPTLSIAGVTVDESAGTAVFDVTLSTPSGLDVSVEYETNSGTAAGDQDYTTISDTLTIAAGDVTGAISVPITADDIDEEVESFTVDLTNPTNATLSVAQATGTITDDDTTVVDFAHAASAAIESSGMAPITVTLSIPAAFTVTVDYESSDGSALSNDDYTPVSGTLRFAPGVTALSFDVPLLPDDLDEADETVMLTLSNAAEGEQGTARNPATLTIVDDDGEPTVNFSDFNYTVAESGASATITVTLSHISGLDVSMDYASSNGTAVPGADYDAVFGTATIPAGNLTTAFTVPIRDDALYENDETVTLALSNAVNAAIGAVNPATLTIADDDPQPEIQFEAGEFSGVEGGSALITVTLSAVSGLDTTVEYASSDGTATAGSDYTPISGTLTIPAGQTQATFVVPLATDSEDEADETVQLALSAATNAVLGEPYRATLTIVDNNFTVYLPVTMNAVTYAPDLIVSSLTTDEGSIQLLIENQGNEPVVDSFWVDLYIDPEHPPQGVDDTWYVAGQHGAVWGVNEAALPLAPGESLTLTLYDGHYHPMLSSLPPSLAAGTPLYAQVDSASMNSGYGGVVEQHEIRGTPYNNIMGPVAATPLTLFTDSVQPAPRSLFGFPARPRAR